MSDDKPTAPVFLALRATRKTPRKDLTPLQRLILILLVDHWGTLGICPSFATLSEETGASRATVARALAVLCDKKILRRAATFLPQGGQTSNAYTVLLPADEMGWGPSQTETGGIPECDAPPIVLRHDPLSGSPQTNAPRSQRSSRSRPGPVKAKGAPEDLDAPVGGRTAGGGGSVGGYRVMHPARPLPYQQHRPLAAYGNTALATAPAEMAHPLAAPSPAPLPKRPTYVWETLVRPRPAPPRGPDGPTTAPDAQDDPPDSSTRSRPPSNPKGNLYENTHDPDPLPVAPHSLPVLGPHLDRDQEGRPDLTVGARDVAPVPGASRERSGVEEAVSAAAAASLRRAQELADAAGPVDGAPAGVALARDESIPAADRLAHAVVPRHETTYKHAPVALSGQNRSVGTAMPGAVHAPSGAPHIAGSSGIHAPRGREGAASPAEHSRPAAVSPSSQGRVDHDQGAHLARQPAGRVPGESVGARSSDPGARRPEEAETRIDDGQAACGMATLPLREPKDSHSQTTGSRISGEPDRRSARPPRAPTSSEAAAKTIPADDARRTVRWAQGATGEVARQSALFDVGPPTTPEKPSSKARRISDEVAAARREKAEKKAAEQDRRSADQKAAYVKAAELYFKWHEKGRGRRPVVFGAADGACLYRILEAVEYKLDAFERIMRGVYEDDFDKDRLSIREIARSPGAYDRKPRKKFGRFLQESYPIEHPRGAGVMNIDDV